MSCQVPGNEHSSKMKQVCPPTTLQLVEREPLFKNVPLDNVNK